MKQKVYDLENMRDRLMDTQSALNAQLTRAKRRQDEAFLSTTTTSPSISKQPSALLSSDQQQQLLLQEGMPSAELQERVLGLMNEVQRLQTQVDEESAVAFSARQEVDLQIERTRAMEANRNEKLTEMMISIQNMARMQATAE